MSEERQKKTTWKHRIWRALAWTLLGIVSLVTVLLLSLQTAPVRAIAVKQVNSLLASTFAGRVVIERLDRLGLTGLGGAHVRVFDPAGKQVLLVDDATVGIATWATLQSVLAKQGDMVIDITSVKLGYVDVNLDADPDGTLNLLRAFEPKEAKKEEPEPSSRATVIHLRHIALVHGWAHGLPQAGTMIDADLDAADLSLIVGGDQTIADLATLDIAARALPGGTALRTHLEAHYAQLSPQGPHNGKVELRGETSGASLTSTFSGQASIEGEAAAVNFHLQSGPGKVDLFAKGTIGDEKKLHATIAARNIDARALAPNAPATKVGLDAALDVSLDAKGNGGGSYWIAIPPGEAAGNLVPATRIDGKVELGHTSNDEATVALSGQGEVAEPGANAVVRFTVTQRDAVSTVDVRVRSVAPHLEQTRLGSAVKGSAALDAHATLTAGKTTTFVDAAIDVRASTVENGGARVDHARLAVNARGNVDDPAIAVMFDAKRVTAGGMRFADVSLRSHGSLRTSNVQASLIPEDGPRIELKTEIAAADGASVRNAVINVRRDDVAATLRVGRAALAGNDVRIEGGRLEGLGEPMSIELTKTDRELSVRASSDGLDLAKIARLLRIEDLRGGQAAINVDMSVRKSGAKGYARAELSNAEYRHVKNGKAHLDARFAGRNVDADLRAELGAVGRIVMEGAHLELDPNRPVDAAAFEDAKGNVDIDVDLDLARLRALLPRGTLPFTDMSGRIRLKGDVARESSREGPEMHVSLATRGLALSGRGDRDTVGTTRIDDTPPWSFEGVDVEFGATITKKHGATVIKARILDRKGTIAELDANAPQVPYRQWLEAKTIDPHKLADLRVAAQVAIPRRELKQLPAILRTQQMGGAMAANLSIDGSLADPDVHLAFEASDWIPPVPRGMSPISAKVDARYRQSQGNIEIGVTTSNKELVVGTVELQGRPPGLPPAPGAPEAPWRASTKMHIADFPLETLHAFSDLQLAGRLSGDLTVDGIHQDARAKIALVLRDLKLGRARFPQGKVNVDFDGKALRGVIRLDQTDGFLQVDSAVGMSWGRETAPTLTDEPGFAAVKAKQFRAAAALPFLKTVFSELDGRIDGDARIDLVPGQEVPKMQGSIVLDRGFAQLLRLGEPLHGIRVKLAMSPEGAIRLDELTARGSTGRLEAKGEARLQGKQLAEARLNIRIPKNEPFPVDIDGQAVGEVDADIAITAQATADQRALNVRVDIPTLHVQIPLSSSNKPQELGEAEKIRVGYFRRPRQFVILPKDAEDLEDDEEEKADKPATTTNVAVHFGDNVEIRRGSTLRIALTGNPKIELSDKTRMSGQIRLTRGMLEVQGRRFRIEKGTVTFVGDDPGNPQIMVTAAWNAPDGTRVFADFSGPLKTGKVRMRSEPSRPQNEILALIMFGTAEGSTSTPYPQQQPNGATRAGAFAGGLATEGLSKGLEELSGLEVSTKIDTSNSANPRPELEVQVARDISVQLAYVLGTPSPGTNPDRTLVTLDWRFRRNWSMETTFGDQGSSIVDFLWQYRY